jgi:hypothetical protein
MGALLIGIPLSINVVRILFTITVLCAALILSKDVIAADLKSASQVSKLNAKYKELRTELNDNQFKRPIRINSTESSSHLKGEIYAVIDYPFTVVKQSLNNPKNWCDLLILHVNVKYCNASSTNTGTILAVNLGKKYDQPLDDTYRVAFNYREMKTAANYMAIELNAANGPMGTHDYRIWVEATPLKSNRTFLHFTYTYSFGVSGRLVMQAYLATGGRDKIGFTILDKPPNQPTKYIKGVRGVVERNTMRYYLAIDAYLAGVGATSNVLEKRLQTWFDSTERDALQLHEMERNDYLKMKLAEYKRQQVTQ